MSYRKHLKTFSSTQLFIIYVIQSTVYWIFNWPLMRWSPLSLCLQEWSAPCHEPRPIQRHFWIGWREICERCPRSYWLWHLRAGCRFHCWSYTGASSSILFTSILELYDCIPVEFHSSLGPWVCVTGTLCLHDCYFDLINLKMDRPCS